MSGTGSYKIMKIIRVTADFIVSTVKRWFSLILPYQSMRGGRELLDAQYKAGIWDYLADVTELSRFSVIVGYCHHYKEGGKILEIGCGEGLLQERLCPTKYSRFVGVDISEEAILRASHKQNDRVRFVREDASTFQSDEKFDVIVFNECLEYFDDPVALVRRYENFLEKDGLFIVSMFVGVDTVRNKRIWKALDSEYTTEAETKVSTNRQLTWIIKVLSVIS